MNSNNINYFFLEQSENMRWYLYALDIYGTQPNRCGPLDGFAYLTDALPELRECWESIGCDVEHMEVYELGQHVASLDIRRHITDHDALTQPYPTVPSLDSLLGCKAGR